jgi:hypothetical protein
LPYELRLESLSAVVQEAASMDADAGIRIEGKLEGRRCFAFVTRFGRRYTVIIFERKKGRGDGPGKRILAQELGGAEELRSLLKKLLSGRVLAYSY